MESGVEHPDTLTAVAVALQQNALLQMKLVETIKEMAKQIGELRVDVAELATKRKPKRSETEPWQRLATKLGEQVKQTPRTKTRG